MSVCVCVYGTCHVVVVAAAAAAAAAESCRDGSTQQSKREELAERSAQPRPR